MEDQALAQEETPANEQETGVDQEAGTLQPGEQEFFDTAQLQNTIVGGLIVIIIAIAVFAFLAAKKRKEERAALNNFDGDDKTPLADQDDEALALTPEDEEDLKKK